MFSIFLPNDNEKWFKTSFSEKPRAKWFAEANDLGHDEFDVRLTTDKIKPSVSVQIFDSTDINQKMVA